MDTVVSPTFHIGDAVVTRIVESELRFAPSTLYPEWETSGLGAAERGLATDAERGEIVLGVHSWLVQLDGVTTLIDTGIGNGKDRPYNTQFHQLNTPYLDRLAAAGVTPDGVDHVLMTHLHVDHVGWNTRAGANGWIPTFPKATYVFAEAEQNVFFTPKGAARRGVFEDSVRPVIDAGQALMLGPGGGAYGDGFAFLPTPGHSAGHMSIELRSRGETAIFTGDFVHTPVQIARPQLASAFCANPAQAEASRLWLLGRAADQNATLFTSHFQHSAAGRVTRADGGFSWRFI